MFDTGIIAPDIRFDLYFKIIKFHDNKNHRCALNASLIILAFVVFQKLTYIRS